MEYSSEDTNLSTKLIHNFYVTVVANFLISQQQIAICIVERWKKSMAYSFVPESNYHASRYVKVFVFFLPYFQDHGLSRSKDFSTMATWRNDFSSPLNLALMLVLFEDLHTGSTWCNTAQNVLSHCPLLWLNSDRNKERKVAFSLYGLTSCRKTSDVISCNPS